MNTYSEDFSNLIRKLPAEAEALRSLEEFVSRENAKGEEYTVRRLFDVCRPKSMRVLNLILEQLIESGVLKKNIKLISPKTGSFIASYKGLDEVPPVVNDDSIDLQIEVSMDDLEVVYSVGDKD
jgi:hypothetical protein